MGSLTHLGQFLNTRNKRKGTRQTLKFAGFDPESLKTAFPSLHHCNLVVINTFATKLKLPTEMDICADEFSAKRMFNVKA